MAGYNPKWFVDRSAQFTTFEQLLKGEIPGAGLLVSANPGWGKTWLIQHLSAYLRGQTPTPPAIPDPLPPIVLDFLHERDKHKMTDGLGLMRLVRDKLNLPQYFDDLNATIVLHTATTGSVPKRQLQILADMIGDTLPDVATLQAVARYAGVDADRLVVSSLPELAYKVVEMAYLQPGESPPAALDLLIERLIARFPGGGDWQAALTAISNARAAPAPGAARDMGGMLRAVSDIEREGALSEISDAFFRGLAALLREKQPVVVLIDNCEVLDSEIVKPDAWSWLRKQLLSRLGEPEYARLIVVLCGRALPPPEQAGAAGVLLEQPLGRFSREYVIEYWERCRQFPGYPDYVNDGPDGLLRVTDGIPGELEEQAQRYTNYAGAANDDAFFNNPA